MPAPFTTHSAAPGNASNNTDKREAEWGICLERKKLLVTYATLHPVNRPMCVNRIKSKSVAPRNKCVVPCDSTGKLKFFFRLESGIHSCLQTIFVPNPSSLRRGCDITNTKIGDKTMSIIHVRRKLWLIQVLLRIWDAARIFSGALKKHCSSVFFMKNQVVWSSTWLIIPSLSTADPAYGAAWSSEWWAHAVSPVFGGRGRCRLPYLQKQFTHQNFNHFSSLRVSYAHVPVVQGEARCHGLKSLCILDAIVLCTHCERSAIDGLSQPCAMQCRAES